MMRAMAEKKIFDFNGAWDTAGSAITNTGLIQVITNMGQGVGVNNRIGDKATISSIEMSVNVYCPYINGLTQIPDTLWTTKISLVLWRDDTTPVLGDIYDLPAGPLQYTPPCWSWNYDKKVKRKILFDKVLCLGTQQNNTPQFMAIQTANTCFKVIIPMAKKYKSLATINFQSNTLTAVNHVYLVIATSASTPGNSWYHHVHCRTTFVDM